MQDLSLWMYISLALLVFLGSLVDAIAGGGGIITLPAYIMVGLPPHMALGSNKFSSCIGTAVSTWRYYRKGFVDTSLIISIIIVTMCGSIAGTYTVLLIPAEILKYIMVAILPFIAIFIMRKKILTSYTQNPILDKILQIKLSVIVFTIGFYDGFYGPGTGTFLIIALTCILHMTAQQAAGNTKISNLTSNVAAMFIFIINDQICYPLAATAAIFSILGHYVGSSILIRNGSSIVRPIIVFVLILLFIKTASDIWLNS